MVDLEGAQGARALPFLQSFAFFCDHFEELQTVLIKVKLIINNSPLTYVYPNTIKTYLTPIICCLADSYYVILIQHRL